MSNTPYTVHTTRQKETGTTVRVYDTHHEACPHKGPDRWMLWCEDHARFKFVRTRYRATVLASRPGSTGWCYECKLIHDGWMDRSVGPAGV